MGHLEHCTLCPPLHLGLGGRGQFLGSGRQTQLEQSAGGPSSRPGALPGSSVARAKVYAA